MKLIPLLVALLIFSCREIVESTPPEKITDIKAFLKKASPYVLDESLDIFLTSPWYTYDEANHIIWPIFQVYSFKSKGQYFKVQVIDYYDSQSQPGFYTLRIQPEGKESFLWDFEAKGCGNVYTNLDYKDCLKNPQKNIYTYLNFKTLSSWKMSEAEALLRGDWDMAFNGTEVKINSGNSGPGDSRIGDLYLYGGFFFNEAADFQEIAEVSFSDKGERFFNLSQDLRSVAFALPPGIDRVVYEPYWFETRGEFFKARPESWWILKGGAEKTYFKFHISNITEEKVDDLISSTIEFEFYSQGVVDQGFGEALQGWKLPVIDSSMRLIKWCLDFKIQEVVDCSANDWDLLLSVSNRRGNRRWRINVNQGAIGPLSFEDTQIVTQGQLP